jgi:hypothetical protein
MPNNGMQPPPQCGAADTDRPLAWKKLENLSV